MTIQEETVESWSPSVEYSTKVTTRQTIRRKVGDWIARYLLCAKHTLNELDQADYLVGLVSEELDSIGADLPATVDRVNKEYGSLLLTAVNEEREANERFDMEGEDRDVCLYCHHTIPAPLPTIPDALRDWDALGERMRTFLSQLNLVPREASLQLQRSAIEGFTAETRALLDHYGISEEDIHAMRKKYRDDYAACYVQIAHPSGVSLAIRRVGVYRQLTAPIFGPRIKPARKRMRKRYHPRLTSEVALETRAKLGRLSDTDANRRVAAQHMRKTLIKMGCRTNIIDMHVSMAVDLYFGLLHHDRLTTLTSGTDSAVLMNRTSPLMPLIRQLRGSPVV